MRVAIAVLSFCAAALAADAGDPDGTLALELQAGGTAPLESPPGANVLCDDLSVVSPEFASNDGAGGFVLRALKPGTTLCGLWLAGQKPGGLYRVHVTAAPAAPDAGAAGAAASDAGGSDAGADGG